MFGPIRNGFLVIRIKLVLLEDISKETQTPYYVEENLQFSRMKYPVT